jgi:hypothetical protein
MFNKKIDRWENVYIKKYGMYYSRIIASWINVGGDTHSRMFEEWLRSITDSNTGEKVLTDDQISDILRLARNGKLEWQNDASRFINEHK